LHALFRILDANSNRAREALRVMEDVARFALNSPGLSQTLKSLRHDLQESLDSLTIDRGVLLASRDTEHDVGTNLTTEGEYQRHGARAVALAASSRLTQALRSIEESAKGLGEERAAKAVEQVRYRAYTAEQRLILALGCGARRQWRLCFLLTESLCTGLPWREVVQEAITGGADCLQLREKTLPDAELLARAHWLRELTRANGVALIINDRPDIARLIGADGVHLGQADMSVLEARSIGGLETLIGVSTEDLDQAYNAVNAGADYCGLGPMFPTTTKEKPRLAGPAYLRAYLSDSATTPVPHLAIGGITPANMEILAQAGCRGVAVSSFICASTDPRAACAALLAALPALDVAIPTP